MKIVFVAEVMEHKSGISTPSMYLPNHCMIRLRVALGDEPPGPDFSQQFIMNLDEVQSFFDLLMKTLTRNMRDMRVSYLEDRIYLKEFPLMPARAEYQAGDDGEVE